MSDDPRLFDVRLLDVPLVLRERSRQQGAELLREMTLITTGLDAGTTCHDAPRRLVKLARELETVYGPYVATSTDEMDAALDRGEETLAQVVYTLPASSVAFVRHVAAILAEVEEYCRTGDALLTLAPPDEVAAYRQWSISEVERQYAGHPATSWPAFAAARAGGTPPR